MAGKEEYKNHDKMGQLKMRRREDGFYVTGPDKEVFNDSYVRIPNTYLGSPVVGIAKGAFEKFKYVEKAFIEEGVKIIEEYAFCSCENLTEIFLPSSLTEIGESAFALCHNLRHIVLPDKVETIRGDAFEFCINLRCVVLSRSLKDIAPGAFHAAGGTFVPTIKRHEKGRAYLAPDISKMTDKENYGIKFWIPKSNFSNYIGSLPNYSVLYYEGSQDDAETEWSNYKGKRPALLNIYRCNVSKEEMLTICVS